MKKNMILIGALAGLAASVCQAQPAGTEEAHLAAAKQAAGLDFPGTLVRTCVVPGTNVGGGARGAIPDRSTWHAEPAQMFDNLYFIGTKIHSAWALKGRDGLIVIDTVFHYAAEDEIVNGLKKLGLNPAEVKYVIISHAHGDHDEGARLLQERYGAHVVMGAADWDSLEKGPDIPGGKPKRDMLGHDGQKISVGDASVTLLETPGHTPGTLSMLFEVKDKGKPLTVAYSGGTAIAGIFKDSTRLDAFVASQRRIAKAAADAGATILMTNHSEFDDAYTKSRLITVRQAGEVHPYEIGRDGVQRYFTLMAECGLAAKARLQKP